MAGLGFEGQHVPDPWGDEREGRWHVAPEETFDHLMAALRAQAERTREIVLRHDLDAVGEPGPRWEGAPPPRSNASCCTSCRSTRGTSGTGRGPGLWDGATGEASCTPSARRSDGRGDVALDDQHRRPAGVRNRISTRRAAPRLSGVHRFSSGAAGGR